MKKLGTFLVCCLLLTGCSNDSKEETPVKEEKKDNRVSFVGVGDNLIHDTIYKEADKFAGDMNDGKYDFTPMYENLKADIEKADLAFINQETILGGDNLGMSGYPTFNSPADIANNLETTGFDLINTATNHCLDKWFEGIENSSALWKSKTNMIAAGTYTSQEDRDTIRTIERNGITFSFLAYTYGTNGIEPPNDYSVAYFDENKIRNDVAKAKEVSDVVIVSAHWGDENKNMVSDYQRSYAQLFADLEVDVVIGTHPHVIQGVETYTGANGNQMPVVYSLGNFISGMLDMNNMLSGMISFDFVKADGSDKIVIENMKWIPLVTHYTGDANNIIESRENYKVYKLSEYTDELASKHGLNGVDYQTITKQFFIDKTNEVIGTSIPIEL